MKKSMYVAGMPLEGAVKAMLSEINRETDYPTKISMLKDAEYRLGEYRVAIQPRDQRGVVSLMAFDVWEGLISNGILMYGRPFLPKEEHRSYMKRGKEKFCRALGILGSLEETHGEHEKESPFVRNEVEWVRRNSYAGLIQNCTIAYQIYRSEGSHARAKEELKRSYKIARQFFERHREQYAEEGIDVMASMLPLVKNKEERKWQAGVTQGESGKVHDLVMEEVWRSTMAGRGRTLRIQ